MLHPLHFVIYSGQTIIFIIWHYIGQYQHNAWQTADELSEFDKHMEKEGVLSRLSDREGWVYLECTLTGEGQCVWNEDSWVKAKGNLLRHRWFIDCGDLGGQLSFAGNSYCMKFN